MVSHGSSFYTANETDGYLEVNISLDRRVPIVFDASVGIRMIDETSAGELYSVNVHLCVLVMGDIALWLY